ncbi:MAG TPA: hypothetical protein VGJ56_15305 [Reyranella sp.]|jgi:hypothetical protein
MSTYTGRRLPILLLVVASCFLGPGAVLAGKDVDRQSDSVCGDDAFQAIPMFGNGDVLPKEGAFMLTLQPVADIVLPIQPKEGLATGYGAVVTLETVAAGRYAIVLSRDARLDAAQQRPFQVLPVTGWTAGAGCLVVAEIRAETGSLTLQVSGVAIPTIMVAIVKLPDDGGYPGRARYQDRIGHPMPGAGRT